MLNSTSLLLDLFTPAVSTIATFTSLPASRDLAARPTNST
jgi:hypothetical protein